MRIIGILFFTICLSFVTTISLADTVYRTIDQDGNISFSDSPTKGAEKIDLPPLQSYTPPPVRERPQPQAQSQATEEVEQKSIEYNTLTIIQPTEEQTLWDNERSIAVTVEINPLNKLQPSDVLEVLVDGNIKATSQNSLTVNLKDVDRGTRVISARIVDDAGKVLVESNDVTVYVHFGGI